MKNTSCSTRDNRNVLLVQLDNLEEILNSSIADINYYLFVLDEIASEYTSFKITRTAEEFKNKLVLAQDELDYLSNCITFLRRQFADRQLHHTLTGGEISKRVNQLSTDIDSFIMGQTDAQEAYFHFANDYFKAIAKAA